MKKQLLTLSLALSSTLIMNAQNGANQKWSQNGDAVTESAFAGTTNNQDYTLKANNNIGMKIKPNGEVVFKSLDLNSSTGPNGLVLSNGQGKIFRLDFPNDATKVLLGNGTFGNFSAAGQWLTSGSNLYWNTGNVSIGSTPNSFKFNVEGDARVSNDLFVNHNLFVGGGVVISDKIQGVTEVKGWDFKVENDLQVTGATRFNGTTQLDQGFTFDGSKGIKFIPGQDNGGIFRYGNNGNNQVLGTPCAAAPTTNVAHQFGGIVQVFDPNDANTGLLNFQTWTGGSSIDASVNGENDPAVLLLNYFCGNDVAICTGTNGGRVAMGKEVSIGGAWPIDPNTALNIRANFTKGLAIQDVNAREFFSVASSGKTTITPNSLDAFDIVDPATTKPTFRIKTNGVTYVKELNVQLTDYPDYVFAKNYSLMPLDVLAKYIAANKHLPNVPSAKEIEANGANLGELNKIQMEKIEELTLYIIEMKKRIRGFKEAS
jgi:hypothetical protein